MKQVDEDKLNKTDRILGNTMIMPDGYRLAAQAISCIKDLNERLKVVEKLIDSDGK